MGRPVQIVIGLHNEVTFMSIDLETPIQFLKGVGPALGERLKRKGIYNINDLVEFVPRAYEDQRLNRKIATLEAGDTVKIKAKVLKTRQFAVRGGRRQISEILIFDETGSIVCKFFRLPFRGYLNNFEPHMEVYVTGTVTYYGGKKEFHHPEVEIIKVQNTPSVATQDQTRSLAQNQKFDQVLGRNQNGHQAKKQDLNQVQGQNQHRDQVQGQTKGLTQDQEQEQRENALVPVYSETEGLSQKKIRTLIDMAFQNLSLAEKDTKSQTEKLLSYDPLPEWIIQEFKLPSRKESLQKIHYPELKETFNYSEGKTPFHYRLAFDELFEMEVLCAYKKLHRQKEQGLAMPIQSLRMQELENSLSFSYTGAQKRALAEILEDLRQDSPMHRLVQGDVGCGKTLVALASALHAIDNGYQVAFMAPTEILAEQHYKNAQTYLSPLGVRIGFLTGSMKASEKQEVLDLLAQGDIDICIGTHALIEDQVQFVNLGLVIIDEQHRFGVNQRQKLKTKGGAPHFLVMTATPIPRTLAMSVYGDLDVSVIDELPPGRSPIQTQVFYPKEKRKALEFMHTQLQKGQQAYIVYPLIEESETLDLKNATEEYDKIRQTFPDFKVGLLHGRMKSGEKDEVMSEFKNGNLHILVSTTVIEVGVDVPNANVMIIENCERFGLSQLHQLRGRVGRGTHQSYCFLVLGDAFSDVAKQRAHIMAENTDGFKISEYDLEMRGPGEFLGAKQSGLPLFRFANLGLHTRLLHIARDKAFQIFKEDPYLQEQKNHKIKRILEKNKKRLALAKIG
ncbi:MAG: ATP-dependent DNA helicase RecG [Bdellovibrionaceae bacterium]|nr:ATP-dependent DNA helicase RecG [Pseudobdellovibrionaceae bacterium]